MGCGIPIPIIKKTQIATYDKLEGSFVTMTTCEWDFTPLSVSVIYLKVGILFDSSSKLSASFIDTVG